MKRVSQVKYGAMISYILIILNSIYGVVMTPFIISTLGTSEYGVYKIIVALSSSIMVMDFGIGGTIQRFIAKYKAEGHDEKIPNFMAMGLIISLFLNAIIIIVSIVVFFLIDPMYSSTFTASELILAKKVFILLVLNALMIVVENVLNGLITGCNEFVFGNGVKLVLLVIRIVLLFIVLPLYSSAIAVVSITIFITIVTFFVEIVFIRKKLQIRIKYEHWDNQLLKITGKYTFLMFLTSVASQVFSNLDNIILGAYEGPSVVTMYSIGLLFFSMFQNLSGGIAGVMLPTITNALEQDKELKSVSEIIIKAGKAQFILLGGALAGFICIGRGFISLWLGDGFDSVYAVTLILLIPSMFELCINVCHSILRAQNRLGFRTGVVIVSAAFNAIATLILVSFFSFYGAAIATALSYIIFSLVVMNYYYIKVIKLPLLMIYRSIIFRVLGCLVISGVALFLFSKIVSVSNWGRFIINVIFFCLVYSITLLLFGLNEHEKMQIPIIRKIVRGGK